MIIILRFYSRPSGFTELPSAMRSQKEHLGHSVSPSIRQVSVVITFTPEPPSINAPIIFFPWTKMSSPGQCGSMTLERISTLATCTSVTGSSRTAFVRSALNLGTSRSSYSRVIVIWHRDCTGTVCCSIQASCLALLRVVNSCTVGVIMLT